MGGWEAVGGKGGGKTMASHVHLAGRTIYQTKTTTSYTPFPVEETTV